jgi:hypothetical protein
MVDYRSVVSLLNQIRLCPILMAIASILVAASPGDVNHAVTFAWTNDRPEHVREHAKGVRDAIRHAIDWTSED